MDLVEIVAQVVKHGAGFVYLIGVVVLYLRGEKMRDAMESKYEALLERYHTLVTEHVRTLQVIKEALEDDEANKTRTP